MAETSGWDTTREVEIRQGVKSNNHFWISGFAFDAPDPVGTVTRKNIYTVPALTNGVDLLNAIFYAPPGSTGDKIMEGKVLAGKIGTVISSDSVAKTVTARSSVGVLRPTEKDGVIDEGFFVSFGTEAFDPLNPLSEFMITSIGDPTDNGDGTEDVVLTLSTFPGTAPTAGQDMNLSVWFIESEIELVAEDKVEVGIETIGSSNLAAGKVVQMAYQRNSAGQVRVSGRIPKLY